MKSQEYGFLVSKIDAACFGCEACAQGCPDGAIAMHADREGFLYPTIDTETCVNCGACDVVCPSSSFVFKKESETQRTFACVNTDVRVQLASSSGGVFRALANHVLKGGGIVYGAMYDVTFNVVHGHATDEVSATKFSGSKYVQSRIGTIYTEVKACLLQNKPVLFSGTPCQVAGLHGYLRRDYESLITVDFVCHGVPSPLVFSHYKEYMTKRYKAEIFDIKFKDKRNGWMRPSLVVRFKNGDSYVRRLTDDIYIKLWAGLNMISRPACHTCPYTKTARESDITIGDFWGIHNVMPDFLDDHGTSLVIVNSHKGETVMDAVSGTLRCRETTIESAMQWNLSAPTPVGLARSEFFSDLWAHGFEHAAHKHTRRPPLYRRIVNRIMRELRKRKTFPT